MSIHLPDLADIGDRPPIATLGMLIIDEFEVTSQDGRPIRLDIEELGGGGIYATTAARLFLPPRQVAFVADMGEDMPPSLRAKVERLGESAWIRERAGGSTRAVNLYSGGEIGSGHQTFRYLARQPRLTLADYLSPPSPFASRSAEWVHVVCDVMRAGEIAAEAGAARQEGWKGQMAWEPLVRAPDPTLLNTYVSLAREYAIFSPNHLELQTILGDDLGVEDAARKFRDLVAALGPTAGSGTTGADEHIDKQPLPAIVVRAGHRGAYCLSDTYAGWTPAYWTIRDAGRVVDPTGGGNSFMGGLLAGMYISGGDCRVGMICGSVAASFAIEQRGPPLGMLSDSTRAEVRRRIADMEHWTAETEDRGERADVQ